MSDEHDKAALVARADSQMHPIVAAAMQAGADPAKLEKLVDLQERWEKREAKKAFDRAMVELKRELPAVLERDKLVDFTSKRTHERTTYSHTSLAAACDAVVPILTEYGFSHDWQPHTDDGQVYVTCELTHTEGHSKKVRIDSKPDTSGSKGPAQAIASTITLLQRYTLLALLGIATADMREPHGPRPAGEAPADDKPNVSRNLRAAAALGKHNRTREQAEAHLDKPLAEWTDADLNKLRDWIAQPAESTSGAAPPEAESPREPGEEG